MNVTQLADVLQWADSLGISLWTASAPDGEKIRFAPLTAAPPDFVDALRAHKSGLLALLSGRQAPNAAVIGQPHPFGLSPFQMASAVAAWVVVGCPSMCCPVKSGLTLLELRRHWRHAPVHCR